MSQSDPRFDSQFEQPYRPAPGYGPPGVPPVPPGNGMAVASLVLGIISLVFSWTLLTLVLSIVGIVLAVSAKKKNELAGFTQSSGVATAGLVLNIIALVLSGIFVLACGACGACALISYL